MQLTQEDQSAALPAPQPAANPFLCTPAVSTAALNPAPQAPTVALTPPMRPFLPGSLLPPQSVGLLLPGVLTTIPNPQGLRQVLGVLPLENSREPDIMSKPDAELPATAGYIPSSAGCQMEADCVPVKSIGSPVRAPSASEVPSAIQQSSEPSRTEPAVMEMDALPGVAAPPSPVAPASPPTIILPPAESHALQTAEMETCTEECAPPKQDSPPPEGGKGEPVGSSEVVPSRSAELVATDIMDNTEEKVPEPAVQLPAVASVDAGTDSAPTVDAGASTATGSLQELPENPVMPLPAVSAESPCVPGLLIPNCVPHA